jgi:hypothetical protein
MPDISKPKVVRMFPHLSVNERVFLQFADSRNEIEFFRTPNNKYHVNYHIYILEYTFGQMVEKTISNIYKSGLEVKNIELIIQFICPRYTSEQMTRAIEWAEYDIFKSGYRFKNVQILKP